MSALPKDQSQSDEPSCCRPAASCIIATEFSQLQADVRTIRGALVGDEALGQKGLVSRQRDDHESINDLRADVHDIRGDITKTRERVLGFVAGATFIGSGVGAALGVLAQIMLK